MSGLLHYIEDKRYLRGFFIVPGSFKRFWLWDQDLSGILKRNTRKESLFLAVSLIFSIWKDLDIFDYLRTFVTDTSVFYLTRHLFSLFLSSLLFHLYFFFSCEQDRQLAIFLPALMVSEPLPVNWHGEKNCSKDLWHFRSCDGWLSKLLLPFPFFFFLIWNVTYSFPLILSELWRKNKGMLKNYTQ